MKDIIIDTGKYFVLYTDGLPVHTHPILKRIPKILELTTLLLFSMHYRFLQNSGFCLSHSRLAMYH